MLTKYYETKQALGGDVTITVVADTNQSTGDLFNQLWKEVYLFERKFSRFLPGSELSRFNRQAGIRQIISSDFKNLLGASLKMSKLSGGVYNPFILPALQRAGYKNSAMPGYENDVVDDHSTKKVVTIDKLELKENTATIPYGTALDMGGCGKGFLADRLADILDKLKLTGYWLSLSGDMVVAGFDDNLKPWQVKIQSADSHNQYIDLIIENNGSRLAVATSGTFKRQNQGTNHKWHHLIDPRTGKPAMTDILLATVVDYSCLNADVLASCAAIVGSHEANEYLVKRRVVAACIQTKNKTINKFGDVFKNLKRLQTAGVKNA